MGCKVRPTTIKDILNLVNILRASDRDEIEALGGLPLNSLLDGYFMSDECYTAFIETKLIGIFGYSKQTHSIWFLGSDYSTEVPKDWLKTAGYYISYFLTKTPILANTVSTKNKLHIKWLKRMGAVFSAPYLINNHYFQDFFILQSTFKLNK